MLSYDLRADFFYRVRHISQATSSLRILTLTVASAFLDIFLDLIGDVGSSFFFEVTAEIGPLKLEAVTNIHIIPGVFDGDW